MEYSKKIDNIFDGNWEEKWNQEKQKLSPEEQEQLKKIHEYNLEKISEIKDSSSGEMSPVDETSKIQIDLARNEEATEYWMNQYEKTIDNLNEESESHNKAK